MLATNRDESYDSDTIPSGEGVSQLNRDLLKAFREQFRIHERLVQQFPDQRKERQDLEALHDRFASFLNEEQAEVLAQFKDHMGWLQDKEKQMLFYQGIMVGIQVASTFYAMGMPGSLLDELEQ
jgi:hypothetical protein